MLFFIMLYTYKGASILLMLTKDLLIVLAKILNLKNCKILQII